MRHSAGRSISRSISRPIRKRGRRICPASPKATGACPRVEEMPEQERDCAVYDSDAAMAENERYREKRPVSAEVQAQLDAYVGPARTAIEGLKQPATVADVKRALGSIGLDERRLQTEDIGRGIRFGASSGTGGCLTGSVGVDGSVHLSTGGGILDGGCLAMSGH
ncbi:hypothetical protein ACW0JT_03050 [Arthrobacter sp. SA17]